MDGKRNAWDAAKFRRVLTQAKNTIECSWGVAGIRNRKTGEMEVVLLFCDDDKESFAYSFSFKDRDEIAFLCQDLLGVADKIHRGEFDANA